MKASKINTAKATKRNTMATSKRNTTKTTKHNTMATSKRNTAKTTKHKTMAKKITAQVTLPQFNRVNVDLSQNFVILQNGVTILTHRGHPAESYHALIHIKRGDVINLAYSEEIVEFLGLDDIDTVEFCKDATAMDYDHALSLKEAKRIYPNVSFTPDTKNMGKVIDKVKVYYCEGYGTDQYTLIYTDGTKSIQGGRAGDYADLIEQARIESLTAE